MSAIIRASAVSTVALAAGLAASVPAAAHTLPAWSESGTARRVDATAPDPIGSPDSPAQQIQTPDASSQQVPPVEDQDDAVFRPAEPDFTLLALPTSLNLPRFKSAVRITHRFRQEIGSKDYAENFFGIDQGAQIGLEFRLGILPRTQVGIQRTSDRTLEIFAQYGLLRQQGRSPVEVAAWGSIERCSEVTCGRPTGRGSITVTGSHYSPAVGAIVTRLVGAHAALYVEPLYVNNSNPLPSVLASHNDTFMLGLGARLRVLPSVYIVGEAAPRLTGFQPGMNHGSVGIEKRIGGHVFQLNFSDSLATTIDQLATANHAFSGSTGRNWYMGFNITRKFY